jgi:hypothetical protein
MATRILFMLERHGHHRSQAVSNGTRAIVGRMLAGLDGQVAAKDSLALNGSRKVAHGLRRKFWHENHIHTVG